MFIRGPRILLSNYNPTVLEIAAERKAPPIIYMLINLWISNKRRDGITSFAQSNDFANVQNYHKKTS